MSIYVNTQKLKIAKIDYQLIFNILLSNFVTYFTGAREAFLGTKM